MGPHTSCAVENLGPEKDTEVKMALPQEESISRPRQRQVTSSLVKHAGVTEESSAKPSKIEPMVKEKVNWSQSSNESDSVTDEEGATARKNDDIQVWEMPIENVSLADQNEEEDYAMMPQIQQALDIMLHTVPPTPTTTIVEDVVDVSQASHTPPEPTFDPAPLRGGGGGGRRALQWGKTPS